MRPLILIAAAALALPACNKKGDSDANRSADAGLTADRIVANDVTAIDAVTADAANMAEDVDYSAFDALDNAAGNGATPTRPGRSAERPRRSAPAPAAETPAETSTNAE